MKKWEYALEGQTINKEYYLETLLRLRNAVRRERPDIWTGKNGQFHHDNAPAHSDHVINGFLAKNNMAFVQQPPYFPDLAPCDICLFPKLKTTLKGMRFQSRIGIMEKTTAEFGSIPEVLPKVAKALGKVCALAREEF